jgi:hypothetical protein
VLFVCCVLRCRWPILYVIVAMSNVFLQPLTQFPSLKPDTVCTVLLRQAGSTLFRFPCSSLVPRDSYSQRRVFGPDPPHSQYTIFYSKQNGSFGADLLMIVSGFLMVSVIGFLTTSTTRGCLFFPIAILISLGDTPSLHQQVKPAFCLLPWSLQ